MNTISNIDDMKIQRGSGLVIILVPLYSINLIFFVQFKADHADLQCYACWK